MTLVLLHPGNVGRGWSMLTSPLIRLASPTICPTSPVTNIHTLMRSLRVMVRALTFCRVILLPLNDPLSGVFLYSHLKAPWKRFSYSHVLILPYIYTYQTYSTFDHFHFVLVTLIIRKWVWSMSSSGARTALPLLFSSKLFDTIDRKSS